MTAQSGALTVLDTPEGYYAAHPVSGGSVPAGRRAVLMRARRVDEDEWRIGGKNAGPGGRLSVRVLDAGGRLWEETVDLLRAYPLAGDVVTVLGAAVDGRRRYLGKRPAPGRRGGDCRPGRLPEQLPVIDVG